METLSPLHKAVVAAGSQAALAAQIGCSQQHVSRMLQSGRVTAEYVLRIEAATGVPRWELRPDLYPPHEYAERAA